MERTRPQRSGRKAGSVTTTAGTGRGRPGGSLLPLEAALEQILAGAVPLGAEDVPVADAAGRVLAEPVVARTSLPPWDNSAMDGFAVRSGDVADASAVHPAILRVVGEVAAGHAPVRAVEAGEALRITTGAMLPGGADAVVPVEDTDADPGASVLPSAVRVRVPAPAGANVRHLGEDIRAGDTVLSAGRIMGPARVALAAASGAATVAVHRRPRVTVLATGDELVAPGAPLGPGQIHDSNTPALLAQAGAAGAIALPGGIVPDEPAVLAERLAWAIGASDVVVLSGGVSVGAHDHVKDALQALGRIEFWRVAIQPGKPLAFGRTTAGRGGTVPDPDRPVALFGLPGNPVSAFVTFELFVRPLLRVLGGRGADRGRRVYRAVLAEAVSKSSERRAFIRVRLEADPAGSGGLVARPAGGQGSHVLSALAAADGLAVIPEGTPGLPAGSEVEVWELAEEGG